MAKRSDFSPFLSAYPPDVGFPLSVNGQKMAKQIKKELQVTTPQTLLEFWSDVGTGYFGSKQLYFFGDERSKNIRDTLLAWNKKDFWGEILPLPHEGGAVWFAETAFGDQLGFRHTDGDGVEIVLFVIDTFNVYTVSHDFRKLYSEVLAKFNALVEPDFSDSLIRQHGLQPDGMHFAPIVSPLVGGSADVKNIHFETPNVHFRTTIALYQSLNQSQS